MEQVFNPLKVMSMEEIRRSAKDDINPIVRFACLREEHERMKENSCTDIYACHGPEAQRARELNERN